MTLHTHRKSCRYRSDNSRRPTTSIQLSHAGIRRSLCLILWSIVCVTFVPGISMAASYHSTGSGKRGGSIVEPVAQVPGDHSPVLAAGFGVQAAGSSVIMVRTYDGPTGAVLSEDSFDVSVKEEGVAETDGNRGRIFAGGIGVDSQGNSKFLLRVYDAETGRFLWEGQLHLLKVSEGGSAKVKATIIPHASFAAPAADHHLPQAFQSLFSVRAVNPVTGKLVWQDQFAPGNRRETGRAGVSYRNRSVKAIGQPIGHIFDLVVRTYDRSSGILLWEDSFEEIGHSQDDADTEPETNGYPHAVPFWHPTRANETGIYPAALRSL